MFYSRIYKKIGALPCKKTEGAYLFKRAPRGLWFEIVFFSSILVFYMSVFLPYTSAILVLLRGNIET